jgi:galactose mutarotase-like enzyme
MSAGCTCREINENGIRAIQLENDLIAATILPDKGADIYSLVSKPHELDVLWKSPWPVRPGAPVELAAASESAWLDQYEGGWQLLFPNGGDACTYRGAPMSFHGEASASRWEYTITSAGPEAAILDLRLDLRRSPFSVSRTLSIEPGSATLRIAESITNRGDELSHYMWGHHPAFGRPFLDGCHLQVPAREFQAHDVEISPFCRVPAGATGPWPVLRGKDGSGVDLSVVPRASERVTEFGYIKDLEQGWYAMVNEELNLSFGLAWPLEVFPYLWFWQELRGSVEYPWYGRCSVMAVEPVTSIPGSGLQRAIENGTAPVLAPGERVEVQLVAVLFGAGKVASIGVDGRVQLVS